MRKINEEWIEIEQSDEEGRKCLIAVKTSSIASIVMVSHTARVVLSSGVRLKLTCPIQMF